MTLDEIEQLTLRQMAEFVAPAIVPGTVGVPWGAEQYAAAIAAMRPLLLKPHWEAVRVYDYPHRCTLLHARDFAVVAREEEYTLLFDPQQQTFVLGYGPSGAITTDAYPSDAVTTFASR